MRRTNISLAAAATTLNLSSVEFCSRVFTNCQNQKCCKFGCYFYELSPLPKDIDQVATGSIFNICALEVATSSQNQQAR